MKAFNIKLKDGELEITVSCNSLNLSRFEIGFSRKQGVIWLHTLVIKYYRFTDEELEMCKNWEDWR